MVFRTFCRLWLVWSFSWASERIATTHSFRFNNMHLACMSEYHSAEYFILFSALTYCGEVLIWSDEIFEGGLLEIGSCEHLEGTKERLLHAARKGRKEAERLRVEIDCRRRLAVIFPGRYIAKCRWGSRPPFNKIYFGRVTLVMEGEWVQFDYCLRREIGYYCKWYIWRSSGAALRWLYCECETLSNPHVKAKGLFCWFVGKGT